MNDWKRSLRFFAKSLKQQKPIENIKSKEDEFSEKKMSETPTPFLKTQDAREELEIRGQFPDYLNIGDGLHMHKDEFEKRYLEEQKRNPGKSPREIIHDITSITISYIDDEELKSEENTLFDLVVKNFRDFSLSARDIAALVERLRISSEQPQVVINKLYTEFQDAKKINASITLPEIIIKHYSQE